ncbi:MAG TPA: type III-A CRISPR-associated protein Csm2 [Spirochaetota bacterium]|nr:type III-A CRISPR-associated protein Csm2 [Spirochaetota bacterium]
MIQITPEYLTTQAEEKAKLFKERGLESSQMRKYYDELKLQEKRAYEIASKNDEFKTKVLPFVKFVKAKIAYGVGRTVSGKKLVPEEFKQHMDAQINRIESFEDLRNFLLHFQAIICYFTYYKERQQDGGRR